VEQLRVWLFPRPLWRIRLRAAPVALSERADVTAQTAVPDPILLQDGQPSDTNAAIAYRDRHPARGSDLRTGLIEYPGETKWAGRSPGPGGRLPFTMRGSVTFEAILMLVPRKTVVNCAQLTSFDALGKPCWTSREFLHEAPRFYDCR